MDSMKDTVHRLLNKLFDSNQEARYKIVDLLCIGPDVDAAAGSTSIRSFVGLLYLGKPPSGSLFNSDGTPRTHKELCHFLRTHNDALWKIVLKLVTHGFHKLMMLWLDAIVTGIRVNVNIMQRNMENLNNTLEQRILEAYTNNQCRSTQQYNESQVRAELMKQHDFTIFMLMDVHGLLRDAKAMQCAKLFMTASFVSTQLQEYYTGYNPFTAYTVNEFANITDINMEPTASMHDIKEYMCGSGYPVIHNLPQILDAASVCVILVSNMYMSMNQGSHKEPLVIELGNAVKANKQAICVAVSKVLVRYIMKHALKSLSERRKISMTFKKMIVWKALRNVIQVKIPSKYLPKPTVLRTNIKKAIGLAGVTALVAAGGKYRYDYVREQKRVMDELRKAEIEESRKAEIEELQKAQIENLKKAYDSLFSEVIYAITKKYFMRIDSEKNLSIRDYIYTRSKEIQKPLPGINEHADNDSDGIPHDALIFIADLAAVLVKADVQWSADDVTELAESFRRSNCKHIHATDPFNILNVGPTATVDVIKSVYRKLALTAHPDKGGSEGQFSIINQAYTRVRNQAGLNRERDLIEKCADV